MVWSIARAALRRRPFSFALTLGLGIAWTSLLGVATPVGILIWATASLVMMEVWFVFEPFVLRHLGREPSAEEAMRLTAAAPQLDGQLVVIDRPEPWFGFGLRRIVVSSAFLDLLGDRGLVGVLAHAAVMQRFGGSVGEPIIWLGGAPMLGGYFATRLIVRLGDMLAAAIGSALVIPADLFPNPFRRYVGSFLGAVMVWLVGATLISEGAPAVGFALLFGWLGVQAIGAVLAWERGRIEALADRLVVESGLGAELLDGLDLLVWTDDLPRPDGWPRLLDRRGARIRVRAKRLEQWLGRDQKA